MKIKKQGLTMTQDNSNHGKDKDNTTQTPSSPTNALGLGGWTLFRNPAAAFSSWGKIKKKVEETADQKIDMRIGSMANDNGPETTQSVTAQFLSKRLLHACALFVMSAGVLSMHSSTIAENIVLNADQDMLLSIMDANPTIVAKVLNAIDVGE